ncbi:plexin domain-containing protein 2, partial [Plakobranchus ocellatus]
SKGSFQYQIANANHLSLSSDAALRLSFHEAGDRWRFKRQAAADSTSTSMDGGAVNADAPTNSNPGNQTLPDDTSGASGISNSSVPTGFPTTTTTTAKPEKPSVVDPFRNADIIHDMHKYYASTIHKGKFDSFWVELESTPRHQTLSDGHRVAVVIQLPFTFYFYGHPVTNVTVATGGFIYMSPFLHQWLTATQYIAPLMANFDPSFAESSSIYYKSYVNQFIVEWRDVVLKDQNSTGKFSFQAILKDDSSITFVYKTVPVEVSQISSDQHPVKIGLSDAYYNDTYLPQFNVKKRTIYEYHKVVVPTNTIMSGTVVVLKSLPTCNRLNDCDSCTMHTNVSFDCRWCNKIGRCSDGLDWFRQHWDIHGCKRTNYSAIDQCPSTQQSTEAIATNILQHSTITQSPITSTFTTATTTSTTTTTTTKSTSPGSAVGSDSKVVPCAQTNDTNECPQPQVITTATTTRKPQVVTTTRKPTMGSTSEMKSGCDNGKCESKKDFPVAVIVVVVLGLLGLIGCVGAWVFYAYTHPTSRSGMWLMEHRPSQIKAKIKFWKTSTDSSAKYKAESEA